MVEHTELTATIAEIVDDDALESARIPVTGASDQKHGATRSEATSSPNGEEIESTAPAPRTRLSRMFEALSKRIGYQHLMKLAAHRGDVSKAFGEVPARMHQVANQTRLILDFIEDFRTGEYRQVPWRTLVIATAAVLYTVSPADVIPDALIGIGALDDLAVIAVATRLIRKDLRAYCVYKGYPVEEYFATS